MIRREASGHTPRRWLTMPGAITSNRVGSPGAAGTGDREMIDQLDQVAARDELQERLSEAFDREILEAAMARVRSRVEPRTWEAFRLTALEGLSGAETAERVGMGIAAAFKAKSKVQRMLREDVRRFQEELVQL